MFARYLDADEGPARHPHQQRGADGAPAGGLLRAHARSRAAARRGSCRPSCSRCSRGHEACKAALALGRAEAHALGAGRARRAGAASSASWRGTAMVRARHPRVGAALAGRRAPTTTRRTTRSSSRRAGRCGSAAGRSACHEQLASHAEPGAVAGDARGAARERGGAVHPVQQAQAADAAASDRREAHRQRVGGGGSVLAPHEDRQAPAHEHGEGRAQHDDADERARLRGRRHLHERRRHGLGDRRGSRRARRRASRRCTISSRRSTSSTARRASATRSSRGC